MKNIQVIDGAENCSFSICLADDRDFAMIFPARGQDVEFIEDLVARIGEKSATELVQRTTTRRIHKRDAMGIHGTLFFQLPRMRKYYPNKREDDMNYPEFYESPR